MSAGVVSVIKSGKEYEYEWKIKNFSLSKHWYRSPYFKFKGESWYLYLISHYTNEYMQLGLWRSSKGSPIEVEFSVSLRTAAGRKNFKRSQRNIFEGKKPGHIYANRSSYIDEWIKISKFITREREFLYPGCLTIVFTMKRADSGESQTASVPDVCCCCKESCQGESLHKISVHEKRLDQPVMCPNCVEIVSLLDWFGHECQAADVKSESNHRNLSQPSGYQHKGKTLQDLKNLFLNQENCDVVLRVQGQEFLAHQAILTARSPVFASTFRSNMREKETGRVDIEDIDPSCFPEFLCFLYCGKLDKLSSENVHSLFSAADKYQIMDLRKTCLEFMKGKLSVDTFCETLVLALLHSETELIESCTDYFVRNAEEITVTVEWQTFVAEYATENNVLFIKYLKHVKQLIK